MLTPATAANLKRKAAFADHVQMHDGKPLFSWIDLNITELCNRSAGSPKACSFCPRIDPEKYPNQRLHMPVALARKIGDELRELNYEGAVVLCGFGEPLLHPSIFEIVECFRGLQVEMVTNGDRLSHVMIMRLFEAGLSYIAVSLYDGPHQLDIMRGLFREAGYGTEYYALRDRWYDQESDFGLKLTNRAGTIDVGRQEPVDRSRPCHYLAYQLTVDWNGDALLCVQDWNKRLRFGNLMHDSLWNIWTSPAMHKRRMQLMKGRNELPCSNCNADGQMHGHDHARAWTA